MKDIAILIPCYNEEATIGTVVSQFRRELPDAAIYVFDNNSTDSTAEIAAESGATVYLEPRQGKGNVVRSMFQKINADIYVLVDGDDTYPADEVWKLIEPVAKRGADMVIGDRLSSTYFTENKRRFHNSGNILVKSLINKIFHCNIHDILTGYRAFSRKFVKNIAIQSSGFEIETELTIFALQYNFNIEEVIVNYKDRPQNSPSKLSTIKDGIRILKTLTCLFRDYKPFAFFSYISILLCIISTAFLIPVFIDYFRTGLVARFPTLICGCALLTAAILFFCSGLIMQVLTNQNKKLMDYLIHSPHN